jgi:ferritin-like metal-binding protein YciE
MHTLEHLFEDTLKDIYYAEKKILKELPKMAKKAGSEDLQDAFEQHAEETEGQIERLEQVFKLIGKAPRGKKCPAIEGIAEEAKEVMENAADQNVLDAGLIAAAQAVEHYEMARYGTLCAWAKELGMDKAASLLEETLEEEENCDERLTELAEGGINEDAAGGSDTMRSAA